MSLFVTLLALLLFLEVTSRLSLFGLAGLDLRRVPIDRHFRSSNDLKMKERVRGTGRPYKPNLDRFFNLVRFRTNSRGLRDKEYALEKPPDTFRVAVLGGSFVMASGVEIEDAFHSVLEEQLSAELAPISYEFINFGVGGRDPHQVLEVLRAHALAYSPDLIIVSVTDLSAPFFLEASAERKERWRMERRRGRVRGTDRTRLRSYFVIKLKHALAAKGDPRLPIEPHPTTPGLEDVVSKYGAIRVATKIPIVFARLEYLRADPTPTDERLQARVAAAGMLYVDTRDAFIGMNRRDFWVHGLDKHPNARAHAIFADVLDEFLRNIGVLGR